MNKLIATILLFACASFAFAGTTAARIAAKQNTTILCIGDSLTTGETYGYPYQLAQMVAARYTDATVIFKSRVVGSYATSDIVLRSGTGGYTITVVRDGVPGGTSYRADQAATIYRDPTHLAIIFLGVNDAANYQSASYSPQLYIDNIGFLARYGAGGGTEIVIASLAWNEFTPNAINEGYAGYARHVARKWGFLYAPVREAFLGHYSGTGNAGQGIWFADPTDPAHFGREAHGATAAAMFNAAFP